MLIFTDIRKLDKLTGCTKYLAVRSLKTPVADTTMLPVLAPSTALLKKYLDLKKAENWNAQTFHDIYLPQFLSEMRTDEARNALNELYKRSKNGETIVIACFCPTESLCHRSILAGMMQGAGASVMTNTGADYSAYYAMYKAE